MGNKKADGTIFWYLVSAAFALAIIFIGLRWFGIIGEQTASAETQSEYITKDCDDDQAQGTLDACPCSKDVSEHKLGQKCPSPDVEAAAKCPNLCKLKSLNPLSKP